MWIMITRHIPTKPAPPPLSWHWAEPWGHFTKRKEQEALFGFDPDTKNAVKIIYEGEAIRLYPHEFNEDKGLLKELLVEQAVIFHPFAVAPGKSLPNLTEEQREIYDAALVDGCDHFQALLVVFGKDPEDTLPPTGWYELKPEYREWFPWLK